MSGVVARSLFMLALFFIALAICIRVYRYTVNADVLLIVLMAWLAHGVIYYCAVLYLFLTRDPFPLELARTINMWSMALRFQILLSLIGILIWHPGRGCNG